MRDELLIKQSAIENGTIVKQKLTVEQKIVDTPLSPLFRETHRSLSPLPNARCINSFYIQRIPRKRCNVLKFPLL